jgi:hypothetical protein
MDRISALRNVEDALAAFEDGECSLAELEREVTAVVRTYATDFAEGKRAFRARGDPRADGLVVLASDERAARERVTELLDADATFAVEPVGDGENF